MGFQLSPLLWDKLKRGLSAGRVQSVALKMVCERQAEIDAFNPEEYWIVGGRFAAGAPPEFTARLHQIDGKKARVGDGDAGGEDRDGAPGGPIQGRRQSNARNRSRSRRRRSSPAGCSRRRHGSFGFSVKRTMGIAQGLYEGKEIGDRGQIGLITYMRTDSTRVADGGDRRRARDDRENLRRRHAARQAERLHLEEGGAGRPRGDPPDHLRPAARRASRDYLEAGGV